MIRNTFLWLSLGFCILSILAIQEHHLSWPSSLLEFCYFIAFVSPLILATGAAILSFTGRSARFSLWVLAFWWLVMFGSSGLYDKLQYGVSGSVAMPVVQILWSVVCIAFLGFDLVKECSHSVIRSRVIALPIFAAIFIVVPLIGAYGALDDENAILQRVFGNWRAFIVYAVIFLGILMYEWIAGTAANTTSKSQSGTER